MGRDCGWSAAGRTRPASRTATRAAVASAPALSYRSSGDFAMPFAITASRAGGTSGRKADAFGTSEFMCANIWANISPSYGLRPVSDSYSTHARA